MQSRFSSICRSSLLTFALLLASAVSVTAQKSDLELLRETVADSAISTDAHYPYGLVEGKRTVDPFYHLASATLYVWQNAFAADVAAAGGYAVSNPEYFKQLTERYGLLPSVFYGLDRTVRNTKIGRSGYRKKAHLLEPKGRIVDTTDRYSSK